MNAFREKLLDFKRRLSDRRMYSVVIFTLAVVLGWGLYEYKEKLEYKQYIYNRYQLSFFNTINYVENVDSLLSKAMIIEEPFQSTQIMMEIWRQAWSAQANLSQLPYGHKSIQNVMKYLNQTGDYAYTLIKQTLNEKPLTKEQKENLEKLGKRADNLTTDLNKMLEDQMNGNTISWEKIKQAGRQELTKADAELQGNYFTNVEKAFADLPSLIYDGPFSDHIDKKVPRVLKNEKEISLEEAKKMAQKFLGDKVKDIIFIGEEINQKEKDKAQKQSPEADIPIKVYSFEAKINSEEYHIRMDIAKKGGKIVWMLNNAPIQGQEKVNMKEAIKKAKEFLNKNGYKNMKESYYQKVNSVAVINFAYVQEDVIMYPDLIKLKIDLTNGGVIGFEAYGYLMSHKDTRELPKIKISEEEAKKRINGDIKVEKVQKAVIPTESKEEVFCWEIQGVRNNKRFLIYVNIETGKVQKILQLLETEGGTLTI